MHRKLLVFVIIIAICSIAINLVLSNIIKDMKNDKAIYEFEELLSLHRITEDLDDYVISNNYADAKQYKLYLNRGCYHFWYATTDSSVYSDIHELLIQAYDPIFLATHSEDSNKEEARRLFEEVNEYLLVLTKELIDIKENDKYILENVITDEQLSDIEQNCRKYLDEVDNYYRNQ